MSKKVVQTIDNSQVKVIGCFNHVTVNDISKVKDMLSSELGITKETAGHIAANSAEIVQLQQRVKDLEQRYSAQELRMKEFNAKYLELKSEYSSLTEQQCVQNEEYQAKSSAIEEEYAAEFSRIHDTIVGWKSQLTQAVSDIQARINRGVDAEEAAKKENVSLAEKCIELTRKIEVLEREKQREDQIEEFSEFLMAEEVPSVSKVDTVSKAEEVPHFPAADYPTPKKVAEPKPRSISAPSESAVGQGSCNDGGPEIIPHKPLFYPTLSHYDEGLFKIEGKKLLSCCNEDKKPIKIPFGVTEINYSAFCECNKIEKVSIPETVSLIGDYAFYGCSALRDIKLSANVKSMGVSAFYGCHSLKTIIIPKRVAIIEKSAFWNCDSLTIYCEAEEKPNGWDKNWNPNNRPVIWGYKANSSLK